MSDNIHSEFQDGQYSSGNHHGSTGRGRSKKLWILLAVVVIVALAAGVVCYKKFRYIKSVRPTTEYQAVFLTNGQVYFGKLELSQRKYARLTEVYYLQVTQPTLQGSQTEQQRQQTQQPKPQPQLSLVKLGNELHGPIDSMNINREHILFYEDIKPEGKVAQAIKEYKANPK